jgi:hypothetical protein
MHRVADGATVMCVGVAVTVVCVVFTTVYVIIIVAIVRVTAVGMLHMGGCCGLKQALLVEYVDACGGLCGAVIGTFL